MKRLKNKNEKGIALLFTLGILSVLLVIALAFATTSITERKAAANNAELTSARLLAESAVQRAIAALRYYDASSPTAAYDVMYSNCPSGTEAVALNNESFDTLWRLATIRDNVTFYAWATDYVKTNANAVHWQYVHDTSDTVNDRIIGRIGYFVTASGGKLDPSMCVSHLTGMAVAAAGTSLPDGTPLDEGAGTEVRNGQYMCEINVKYLDNNDSGFLGPAVLRQMSSDDAAAGGVLPDASRWPDFDTFINCFASAPLSTPLTPAQKSKFNDWFIVSSSSRDEERFWIDGGSGDATKDGNGLQDTNGTGEWYNRFNIARIDWGTTLLGVGGITILTGPPAAYSSGAHPVDGTSIPWISNFGKKPDGTDDVAYKGSFGSVADRRKQIAANIIDYCDADSVATTNDADAPLYTGNDRTPYINEIQLHFDGNVQEVGTGPSTYTPTARIAGGSVELCDMYGIAATNFTATILIEGSYKWLPTGNTFTFTRSTTATIATNGAKGYITGVISPVDISDAPAANQPGSQPKSITELVISTLKIKLTDATGFADYSYVEPNGTVEALHTISSDGTGGNRYISYQLKQDPRQNLFAGDWGAQDNDDTGACGTLNTKNTLCDPTGGGKDLELATALNVGAFSISTAYIRNAPMLSPWELGFIHRGAAWETLNLKKYNRDDDDNGTPGEVNTAPYHPELGVSLNIGGRAYEKGDANILDQIKMTKDTNQGYGKINIRASNVDSLRALLGNITTGAAMVNPADAPGASGSTILNYNNNVIKIANAINGSDKRPFITRAMVTNVPMLTDGTSGVTQDRDALKEEIIGKFINLTKASIADEFTIIAIAQSIKDIGGPAAGAGIPISKDVNADGVLGTFALGTIADPRYYWDGTSATTTSALGTLNETITGCKIGQYDLGADEILAEQKVMCVIKKSSTGKWEIVRYEYIE